jgi:hypothetical protein
MFPVRLFSVGLFLFAVIALRLRIASLVSSILSATGLFIRSFLSAYLRALFFSSSQEQSRFAPDAIRRFACVALVTMMMINPVMSSPQISHSVVDVASATIVNSWRGLYLWWHWSGRAAKFDRLFRKRSAGQNPSGWDGRGAPPRPAPQPKPQETQEQRNARVVRVEIAPRDVTVAAGEPALFTAVAYDANNSTVAGVQFDWEAEDEADGQSANSQTRANSLHLDRASTRSK